MWPVISALVWKQLKQRYRRNYVPLALSAVYPLFGLGVFTIVFTKIARVGSEGVPYAAFNFTALVPWFFFASSVRSACASMTSNVNLVTRLAFPRAALPAAALVAAMPSLAMNLALLVLVLLHYGIVPGPSALWLFPLLAVQLALTLGIALAVSVLNAYSRATMTLLGFLLQAWLIASPVVYSLDGVPARHRALYLLNPLAAIFDGWRKALLHHRAPELAPLGLALGVSIAALAAGWALFGALEKNAADVVT